MKLKYLHDAVLLKLENNTIYLFDKNNNWYTGKQVKISDIPKKVKKEITELIKIKNQIREINIKNGVKQPTAAEG